MWPINFLFLEAVEASLRAASETALFDRLREYLLLPRLLSPLVSVDGVK